MRTPIRKPGKYSGLKADANITQGKFEELQRKLERLLRYSRPEAIKEVKRLAADGDFSENHAYSMAKGRLRGINRRIDEIQDWLKRAEIIDPTVDNDHVRLGSYVTILSEGKEKTYQILGSSETDPSKNIISHLSPLGSALMGKRIGELVKLKIGTKNKEYKIIGFPKNLKRKLD
jgi:transcription elongation factor GreA